MDPNFNSVWSASEINMVRSLVTSHITNNTHIADTNKKNVEFVEDLQAMFPWKEKNQVIGLYVELVVEMTMAQGNNQDVMGSSALMNDNFGMLMKAPPMDNMDMLQGCLMDGIETMRPVEGRQNMLNAIPKQKTHAVKFWTIDEHRNFLRGLEVFGRGKWKNISKYFVPTRTPVQISSHAQKYFRRQECTTKKQRFSINDVGLYDTQPSMQNNSSRWETLTFTDGAYNTNYCGFDGKHVALNNLMYTKQVSNNQVATWMTTTSSVVPMVEENESQTTNNGHQLGGFVHNQWMDKYNMD